MNTDLLTDLNPSQQKAAKHEKGPMLVIAGAGSGKTRVLTHRVACLIQKGIQGGDILAITFTNKAAREMVERVEKLLGVSLGKGFMGYNEKFPTIGTFHALGAQILRKEADKLNYTPSFAIYDEEEQKKLVRNILREQNISEEQFPIQRIRGFISQAKNDLIPPEKYLENPENYFEEKAAKVFKSYQKALIENNAVDFDDLIILPVELLKKDKERKAFYQNKFKHILVDEYQDTNHAQYQLVKILGENHRNVFVVGDDFQSIYGWRGANIQNILNFEKDYSEAKVVLLEQNYRSTQNILDAAYNVIKKNVNQKDKKMWTEKNKGELITTATVEDEKEEANFIVNHIKKLNTPLKEVAVLYRTNAQSRALEEAFLEKGVPYHLVGALRFYARAEIKDILAYLRIITNPRDEMNLRRIYNMPRRGLGKIAWKKMMEVANDRGKSIGEVLLNEDFKKEAEERMKPNQAESWVKLSLILKDIKETLNRNSLKVSLEKITSITGYEKHLLKMGIEGESKLENVRELSTVAEKYGSKRKASEVLKDFLEEVSLLSAEEENQDGKDRVQLMTLHSAKGLEFDIVFIAGMEEGIFPHSSSALDPKEMEEERRLCYVGITRAKKAIYLINARTRHLFGNLQANNPSRFIKDIPEHLTNNEKAENEFRLEVRVEEEKKNSTPPQEWKEGDKAFHAVFGKGMIVEKNETILSVAFPGVGIKKLDAGIAPLKKITERKRGKPVV